MTIYNPNRFVTGLSDIGYVKQVDRIQKTHKVDEIVLVQKPDTTLTIQQSLVIRDRFVKDTFTPEGLPDPVDTQSDTDEMDS